MQFGRAILFVLLLLLLWAAGMFGNFNRSAARDLVAIDQPLPDRTCGSIATEMMWHVQHIAAQVMWLQWLITNKADEMRRQTLLPTRALSIAARNAFRESVAGFDDFALTLAMDVGYRDRCQEWLFLFDAVAQVVADTAGLRQNLALAQELFQSAHYLQEYGQRLSVLQDTLQQAISILT